jgi:phage-related protein
MLKPLIWMGSSRSDLKGFPEGVQDEIGYSLYQAQLGYLPDNAKPMAGMNGVIEISDDFKKNTYRAVYAIKLGESLYVLHAFQKKSKQGIETPKKEMDLVEKRLKQAQQIYKELGYGKKEK